MMFIAGLRLQNTTRPVDGKHGWSEHSSGTEKTAHSPGSRPRQFPAKGTHQPLQFIAGEVIQRGACLAKPQALAMMRGHRSQHDARTLFSR
jgi:hypothetical protein